MAAVGMLNRFLNAFISRIIQYFHFLTLFLNSTVPIPIMMAVQTPDIHLDKLPSGTCCLPTLICPGTYLCHHVLRSLLAEVGRSLQMFLRCSLSRHQSDPFKTLYGWSHSYA